jgi:hypothetical protein
MFAFGWFLYVVLFFCDVFMFLGDEVLSVCHPSQGAPFVSHKSLGGRRKSIHPGADLPDITMAVNYARLGARMKEVEVLSVCLFIQFLFNILLPTHLKQ